MSRNTTLSNQPTARQVVQELSKWADSTQVDNLARFFKTGPGEYGEGDQFIGVTMPHQRKVAKQFQALDLREVRKLLNSPIHEHRMTGLLILIHQYSRADSSRQDRIYEFYLEHLPAVNNWDLVDSSAPHIIGNYLLTHPDKRPQLYTWARSTNLWERRIAILSTYTLIKHHQFNDALKISSLLLNDPHDLIHKAVGWMLREIGNRDQATEEKFLQQHYRVMPRTMLRYAIEKFPEQKRQAYLKSTISQSVRK